MASNVLDYRGVSAEDDWELAVFADPLTHVSGDNPPVFLLHGCWGQYLPVTQPAAPQPALQELAHLQRLGVWNVPMVNVDAPPSSPKPKHLCRRAQAIEGITGFVDGSPGRVQAHRVSPLW